METAREKRFLAAHTACHDEVYRYFRRRTEGITTAEDREVLLLTYWDGFTSAEVSHLLNVTAPAVRMRLHRARKELSRLLLSDQATEERQQ
ncbi:RNA polymerase sigma factor [Paenarthrobacter sp. NCHU4564]|uniref:RNA polymerase sigma factor n=1 Tax=Paenarthrobacter sp. NCHU4564 TaxID=3451353 RepID=UPI003F9CE4D3